MTEGPTRPEPPGVQSVGRQQGGGFLLQISCGLGGHGAGRASKTGHGMGKGGQSTVAGPFSYAPEGCVYVSRARAGSHEGIGYGHAQIVMGVDFHIQPRLTQYAHSAPDLVRRIGPHGVAAAHAPHAGLSWWT